MGEVNWSVVELIRRPVKWEKRTISIRRDFWHVLRVYAAKYDTNVSRLINDAITNMILEDKEMQELLKAWWEEWDKQRLSASK